MGISGNSIDAITLGEYIQPVSQPVQEYQSVPVTLAPISHLREDWVDRAACAGSGQFFYAPEKSERKSVRIVREERALEICRSCVVVEPCLDDALKSNEKYGVWGGTTEKDRRRMKRNARKGSSTD